MQTQNCPHLAETLNQRKGPRSLKAASADLDQTPRTAKKPESNEPDKKKPCRFSLDY